MEGRVRIWVMVRDRSWELLIDRNNMEVRVRVRVRVRFWELLIF
jgi:hypothetical protein